MQRHKLIKERRQQLGMTADEMAKRVGVSIFEYHDIEAVEDELIRVTPLKETRRLAEALELNLETLLEVGEGVIAERRAAGESRSAFIARARKDRGVSIYEMGDGIGFEVSFVRNLEEDDDALESYPYEVLEIVAEYLRVSGRDLLHR